MATFAYKAKDRSGKLVEGQMAADAPAVVTGRLQAMGLFPVSVAATGEASVEASLGAVEQLMTKLFGLRISIEERAQWFRALADLIGAGVPLAKSLTVVTDQTSNVRFRALLASLTREVMGGERLYRAMTKHGTVFRKLEVSMIHAGEEGGLLEDVLNRLADFTEREKDMRDKLIASLTYPMIMVVAGFIVVGVLVTFVFPRIVNVYSNMNQELPAITTALIAASDFMRSWWKVILAGMVGGGVLLQQTLKTPGGRLAWDGFLLKLPRLNAVILNREIAGFSRTLGALLQNGVSILTALDITHDVLGNEVVRRALAELPERVTKGEGVSGPMKKIGIFPAPVINMIAVGEETGNLDKTLLRIANTHERKVETEVRRLTSLIEPAIMICIAAAVAVVVIAMLLPLVGMDPSGGI